MSFAASCSCLRSICMVVVMWCLCELVLLLSNCATAQQTNAAHTTATLSEIRAFLAATSSGELVFFGGGYNTTEPSDRVDIYNATSGNWTTSSLSVARYWLTATSSGNLVFFAGGLDRNDNSSNQVDIYNTTNGSWSTATLSQPRWALAATSVGNVSIFAGGGWNFSNTFNVVDIYNVTNNTWTTATLSQARAYPAATSVANHYALFAGGYNGSTVSNVVDIYDSWNETWSTATLSLARNVPAATSLDNLAFIAGGDPANFTLPYRIVDIFNATSQTWSTATLSQSRTNLAATSIDNIVAFGGGDTKNGTFSSVVDIYSLTSNIWFTVTLSQARNYLAAASSPNKTLFGGGQYTSNYTFSAVVDIFDISLLTPPAPVSASPLSAPGTSLPSASANTNNSTALLAGILGVVAALIVAAIILLIVFLRKKRKNKNLKTEKDIDKVPITEHRSDSETVVLDNTTNTVTLTETNTTVTTYQPGTETLKTLSPSQISLNELEIGKEIGQGTYGRVCVGKWKKYRVALKFCQNRGKLDEFMREANLMIILPPHPNVVRMYGVSIDGTQPIIVMEYCAGGSLDKVLYDKENQISTEKKIRWVHEIALGMCHLHKHNIVHRDLAARNILLSHTNFVNAQPKISDFGMSRVLAQTVSEGSTLSKVGPVCWMAPESLEKQIYSKKSDAWMFGVLVYEIVAREEPFPDDDPMNICTRIRKEGLTPSIPRECPAVLCELMQMCWKKDPEQRPTFENILNFLERVSS